MFVWFHNRHLSNLHWQLFSCTPWRSRLATPLEITFDEERHMKVSIPEFEITLEATPVPHSVRRKSNRSSNVIPLLAVTTRSKHHSKGNPNLCFIRLNGFRRTIWLRPSHRCSYPKQDRPGESHIIRVGKSRKIDIRNRTIKSGFNLTKSVDCSHSEQDSSIFETNTTCAQLQLERHRVSLAAALHHSS